MTACLRGLVLTDVLRRVEQGWWFLAGLLLLVTWTHSAHADTWFAPIGGRPFHVEGARVVCGPNASGWTIEAGGHELRPPTAAAAIGRPVEFKTAATTSVCAAAKDSVTVTATARFPVFDAGSFVLTLDEGRLEGRGRDLRGSLILWPGEQGFGVDACREPKTESGIESCTWGVPKTIAADPATRMLRWWPAGVQPPAEAVLFNAEGKVVSPAASTIVPNRVLITQLLPSDASVDVSSGVGLVRLTHPGAVASVECANARCGVENGQLSIQAPTLLTSFVDVKFRLTPHVFFVQKGAQEVQTTLRVSVLRCPMNIVSGPVLRATESARIVVRFEGGCARDAGALRFLVGSRRVDVVQTETIKDVTYVVLGVGSVDTDSVSVTSTRGEGEGGVVAVARTDTRPAPQVRTTLVIPEFPPVDFVPNNRPAIVHQTQVSGAELALLPVEDVYSTKSEGGVTTVQGDIKAAGSIALRFGYRIATLPAPLDRVDLAVLTDSLQRSVKEASIPAPVGTSAFQPAPLVEVLCVEDGKAARRVQPGITARFPFEARDSCRVIFHRERLSREYGTQKLQLDIDVRKLDGTPRPDGRISETIVLRSGQEPRIAWIKGIVAPYDRVIVRLSHAADESHYLGALEIPSGAPAVQWTLLLGTGRFRVYATSAIPTGLYRFGGSAHSGVLSLNFGVLSRLTWLDSEGHEGLLGLEAGVMAFGLTGDNSSTGQSLTQVGAVGGIGLSIPIANSSGPVQAAINLHAWFEQRLTGSGPEADSPRAIIFGPSISIGNVGTNF